MSEGKPGRDLRDYINDILETIQDVFDFTRGLSFEEFSDDKKTLYAVIRCLGVIGESVKNIPKEIRANYPDMPWQEIAGMRNKLIHEYFGIDRETVWDTIQEDLRPLRETVLKVKKEL